MLHRESYSSGEWVGYRKVPRKYVHIATEG